MKIKTFSLPAGKTCPGAVDCKSMAVLNKDTGKLSVRDGAQCKFRCFAASQEAQYSNTYKARLHNLNAIKGLRAAAEIADILDSKAVKYGTGNAKLSSNKKQKTVRIHVSGDFYSQEYFDAWCEVARRNPTTLYYAYTKSIPFWIARLGSIPSNLVLTASLGGKFDSLAREHGLKTAEVVFSEAEAAAKGLPIDHDDSYAMKPGESFALLVHGTQPKGSEAAQALVQLKKKGKGGYSAKK